MKVLFIIQGEGRGHLTQAMTMERLLMSHGHEVVGMLVGKSESRKLPAFFTDNVHAPISYFETINFVTASSDKKPDALKTILFNVAVSPKFFPSVSLIRSQIKESGADIVVNFYELLGTIGYELSGKPVPMVCIAHQFLFLHDDMHIPEFGYEGHIALNLFSRAIAGSATKLLALSFRPMPDDPGHKIKVVPPLLRPEVLSIRDTADFRKGDYILGYMLNAGFAEEVNAWHEAHPEVPLHFFWDNAAEAPVKVVDDTLSFYYLDDKEFIRQMAGCMAYASTAGFESICEAMYLGKPLMMVPSHIEQKCNAFDATKFSAAIESDKFDLSILLNFSQNGFVPDEGFPQWALSAGDIIIRELEALVAGR